jgi:hypothetical protein
MNPTSGDSEDNPEDYVSFGWFDPLVCKRIMKRLSRDHIRFAAADASGVGIAGYEVPRFFKARLPYPILHRLNGVELFVHSADADRARGVIGET